MPKRSPGVVRDAIIEFMRLERRPLTVDEIYEGARAKLGEDLPRSSVRSYLGANVPEVFERVRTGTYRLAR
jgi:hypothetical protein